MMNDFSGKNSFMSNFYPCYILDRKYDILFSSSEHMYQSRKTNITREKLDIQECMTPGKAKRQGRLVTLRSDWETIKIKVMEEVLFEKFTQNPQLARELLATGIQTLVEGNHWHDTFWGVCYCSECGGNGMNWLGTLLQQLREKLRKGI